MIVPSQTLAVFALAALAILAVPGPAVIYIVTRSIHQGGEPGSPRCSASTAARSCT